MGDGNPPIQPSGQGSGLQQTQPQNTGSQGQQRSRSSTSRDRMDLITFEGNKRDQTDFKLQRLNGKNWAVWKWQVVSILTFNNLMNIIKGLDTDPDKERQAMTILVCSIDQVVATKLVHCTNPKQIWNTLENIYENKSGFGLTDLLGRMNSMKFRTLNDVENGVSEIRAMAAQINSMGGNCDRATVESAILRALPETFSGFISSWALMESNKRSIENLQVQIMMQITLLKDKQPKGEKLYFAEQSAGKNNKTQKKSRKSGRPKRDRKDLTCYNCQKKGHFAKECRKSKQVDDKTKVNDEEQKKESNKSVNKSWAQANVAMTPGAGCYKAHVVSDYVESTWIADTGASFHMTSHKDWLGDYQEFRELIEIRIGNNEVMYSHGKGFLLTDEFVFEGVHYVPEVAGNLLSVSRLTRSGDLVAVCKDSKIMFMLDDKKILQGRSGDNGVYKLNLRIKPSEAITFVAATLDEWHQRLGHVSKDTIRSMAKKGMVEGLMITRDSNINCEVCAIGKCTAVNHPTRLSRKATAPGQIIHLDTAGPMPIESFGGALYFVLAKDEYTRYKMIFFAETKSDITTGIKLLLSKVKLDTGNDTLEICTDQGTEFKNEGLASYVQNKGIRHIFSCAYTPQQNGFIERDIRTVKEAMKTMLIDADLPNGLWAEAACTAVYVLNRVPAVKASKTPYELWHGEKPCLNNLHKFGQEAIVKIKKPGVTALDPKGEKMVFVGYTEKFNTFRFADVEHEQLVESCDAIFLKKTSLEEELDEVEVDITGEDYVEMNIDSGLKTEERFFSDSESVKSSRNESSKFIVDSNSSIDTLNRTRREFESDSEDQKFSTPNKLIDIEEKPKEESGQGTAKWLGKLWSGKQDPEYNPKKPIMVSNVQPRKLRGQQRIDYKPQLFMAYEEDGDEPTFYEALNRGDYGNWKQAMEEELEALEKNKVFELVDRPNDQNVVTNRWVLRIKRKPDGSIGRYKARLVARGFSQRYGIDYNETYAPVVNMSTVRLLFAHAAVKQLEMVFFDIKTAFLYGVLDETVYMEQPDGFCKDRSKVWLLKRSLYGLKQAPRQWNIKFTEALAKLGLKVLKHDRCIFYSTNPLVIIAIYVDDGIILARSKDQIAKVLEHLKSEFEVNSVDGNTYLGFQINRKNNSRIFIHQEAYINKILKKYGMDNARPERSPISITSGSSETTALQEEWPFREAVGSLMYATVTTRVDIAHAVNRVSRRVAEPRTCDLQALKRILRYLVEKESYGIEYSKEKNRGLEVYCDADYAGDETYKSTTGMVILYGGGPIHWKSSRQHIITTSSTEAEYVSLCTTVKEVIWLRKLARELNIIDESPTTILCDNQSAIRLAHDERCVQRTKHINVQVAYSREQIEAGEIEVKHVATNLQLADMLTKPTSVKQYENNRDTLMTSKSLALALIVICMLSYTMSGIDGFQFDTVRPILYKTTDNYVDIGALSYEIHFTYANPCEAVTKNLGISESKHKRQMVPMQGPPMRPNVQQNTPNGAQTPPQHGTIVNKSVQKQEQLITPAKDVSDIMIQHFKEDCQIMFERTWQAKLKEIVSTGKNITHTDFHGNRRKRDLGDVILGVVLTNFVSTIFELIVPDSKTKRLASVEKQLEESKERMKKFEKQFNTTKAIEEGIIELVKMNSINIREQQRQLTQFGLMSERMSWLSAFIQTKLVFAAANLREIQEEIKNHRVATDQVAELFNMPEFRQVDKRDTKFYSADVIGDRTIRFKFLVRNRSPDTVVYQIHAFRYWDHLLEKPQLMEYKGKEYAIYNKTANCMKAINPPTQRAVYQRCMKKDHCDETLKIWKAIITTNDVYKQHNLSDWKQTLDYNYVYCFPRMINIDNKFTAKCPTQVFRLSLNTEFSVDDITYKPLERDLTIDQKDLPFIDDVLNVHFVNDSLMQNDGIMFDKVNKLRILIDQLEQEKESTITITNGSGWVVVVCLFFTLIIACTGLIVYNIILHQQGQIKQEQLEAEVKVLKSDYGSSGNLPRAVSGIISPQPQWEYENIPLNKTMNQTGTLNEFIRKVSSQGSENSLNTANLTAF